MLLIRSRLLILALALASLLPAPRAAAQPLPAPAAGDEVQVFLLTMGQGDLVWEKFGHNALWIHDPVRGTDRVYNYGVFDFNSPGYWGRFLKGNWIYQLAVGDIYNTLAQYQYFDRSVVAQELNLSPGQKQELQAFLEWNALPQNAEYRYDYFRDNCSTRLRDVLNATLDGALFAATAEQPTGTTYRWHSRRLIQDDEIAYTGMNAGLGPPADRPIDRWEEMFLPGKLHDRVAELRIAGPDGAMIPLVASETTLYQAAGRDPESDEAPNWIPAFLAIGVALGLLLAGLARAAATGRRVGRFAFAAVGSLFSLIVGTGGLLLVALWALTDHTIAHRNENLLHFDPLAWGLVVLVPALAFGARWAAAPARMLALAIAALSLLGLLLQPLPGLDQVNGEVIALLLPAHLGLAWGVDRLARGLRAARPAEPSATRRARQPLATGR